MKGAPPGGMDVGDSMMGPGKVRGLSKGAACSTCVTWKTKTHITPLLLRLKQNEQKLPSISGELKEETASTASDSTA